MKPREDVARYIEKQMQGSYTCSRPKPHTYHYGLQELRELMDFIYGAEPTEAEKINRERR
jgi:hypothetical protein